MASLLEGCVFHSLCVVSGNWRFMKNHACCDLQLRIPVGTNRVLASLKMLFSLTITPFSSSNCHAKRHGSFNWLPFHHFTVPCGDYLTDDMKRQFHEATIHTRKFAPYDMSVHLFKHPQVEIYLLGTNHVATLSVEAANDLISRVKPHVVGTELCLRRLEMANILGDRVGLRDQYQQLVSVPKKRRRAAAIEMQRLRLVCQALEYANDKRRRWKVRVNKRGYRVRPVVVGDLAIGADMFAPFGDLTWRLESREPVLLGSAFKNYKILLIDRPLEKTYSRVASALTNRELEVINQYKDDFVNLFLRSGGDGIMMNIWRANRQLMKIEIQERDEYLAWSLLRASNGLVRGQDGASPFKPTEPVRIVGLVGQRHVPGIMQIWRSNRGCCSNFSNE